MKALVNKGTKAQARLQDLYQERTAKSMELKHTMLEKVRGCGRRVNGRETVTAGVRRQACGRSPFRVRDGAGRVRYGRHWDGHL